MSFDFFPLSINPIKVIKYLVRLSCQKRHVFFTSFSSVFFHRTIHGPETVLIGLLMIHNPVQNNNMAQGIFSQSTSQTMKLLHLFLLIKTGSSLTGHIGK